MSVTISTDSRQNGRCTKCRRNVTWATKVGAPRHGTRVCLDRDAVPVLTGRIEETWQAIETYDDSEVHQCP